MNPVGTGSIPVPTKDLNYKVIIKKMGVYNELLKTPYNPFLAYIFIIVSFTISSVYGQDSLNIYWLGSCLGEMSHKVVYSTIDNNHYLFVLLNGSILVLDVNDPSNPQKIAEVGYPGGIKLAGGLSVVDTFLYITTGSFGLWVYNVANPHIPIRIGSYDTGWAAGIAVSGNYAYIGDIDSGLVILDISNPASPVKIGCLYLSSSGDPYADVAIKDTFAYVAIAGKLRIVNVANPAAPFLISVWNPNGPFESIKGVAVQGNFVYLSNFDLGFWVVDVSNPQFPVTADYITNIGYGLDVAVDGNYAYYAADIFGIGVINISNPYDVRLEGHLDIGFAVGIYGYGENVYATTFSKILVIDVSNHGNPVIIGSYNNLTGPNGDIAISGNYAYVSIWESLRIVDVSNPNFPFEVGFCRIPARGEGLAVSNNYAYVASGDSGLRIIDVSNPSVPYEVGHIEIGFAHKVVVDSIYAYVIGDRRLHTIDVSNPSSPFLVSTYHVLPESIPVLENVYKSGNYVYLLANKGLFIIDVSNPYSPYQIGFLYTFTFCNLWSMVILGNNGYVIGSQFLHIDLSDPSSPIFLDTVLWSGEDITNYENYGYISGMYPAGPLYVVDLSNPFAPNILGYYDFGPQVCQTHPFHIAHSGYNIFVLTDCGLQIFRFTGAPGIEEVGTKTKEKILNIYPNPFLNCVTIKFQIPESKTKAALKIYDVSGRLVKQWDDKAIKFSNKIVWDGTDNQGNKLPSGIYFCRLVVQKFNETQKIILLR